MSKAAYNVYAAGGAATPTYIEDVFSTYLYTGNGSTQTITNGIDLSTKGGLVWLKNRSNASTQHALYNTDGGQNKVLHSDSTDGYQTNTAGTEVSSFNSNGFSLGTNYNTSVNTNNQTYVSWTFREQAKFFDIVTYTGTGTTNIVSHNLGSMFGAIIIKKTSSTSNWLTMIRKSNGNYVGIYLNNTDAAFYDGSITSPGPSYMDSSTFNPNWINSNVASGFNDSGATYVAYLFAHNAGGFGLTGSDNVISCGSVTADGAGSATVNLGYEPQWLLVKSSSAVNGWAVIDTMRGLPADGLARFLFANTSGAESGGGLVNINATGFYANATLSASATYIYIAIRRGPMKVPTVGTSVFSPVTRTGTGANDVVTAGFPPDLALIKTTTTGSGPGTVVDRLRGAGRQLLTSQGASETSPTDAVTSFNMSSISLGSDLTYSYVNNFGWGIVNYLLRRAPGFFDIVCYTGNGASTQYINHNLRVTPELIICKKRSASENWYVYHPILPSFNTLWFILNSTATGDGIGTGATSTVWQPTSTTFKADGNSTNLNDNTQTYVAYLFATCPGVSKVGSYTGNGSTQTIDCGFAAGARFVLIKRTDSIGDWYVFDTARGIVSGNDPFYKSNTPAAEVTAYDAVDPANAGFIVNNDSTNYPINESGGTYIFLAIA